MLMSDLTHRSLACKVHLDMPIENALYKFITIKKTYFFQSQILATSMAHKFTAKMHYSLSNITAFDENQSFCRTFLSRDLQCLPLGDPRIICA